METLIPQLDPAKLRNVRKAAGLSAQELADALQISIKQVFNYENGFSRMPANRLILLKRVCGVTQDSELYTDALPGAFSTRKKYN